MKITNLKETQNGYKIKAKSFYLTLYNKYLARKLKKYGWAKKKDKITIDWIINIDIKKEKGNEWV